MGAGRFRPLVACYEILQVPGTGTPVGCLNTLRLEGTELTMAIRRAASGLKSKPSSWERARPDFEVQNRIGKAMQELYQPPKTLPDRLSTLLIQLDRPDSIRQ